MYAGGVSGEAVSNEGGTPGEESHFPSVSSFPLLIYIILIFRVAPKI